MNPYVPPMCGTRRNNQIVEVLCKKLGSNLAPHISDGGSEGSLIPELTKKLGDNKVVVRQAALQVFGELLNAVGARALLGELLGALDDSEGFLKDEQTLKEAVRPCMNDVIYMY